MQFNGGAKNEKLATYPAFFIFSFMPSTCIPTLSCHENPHSQDETIFE